MQEAREPGGGGCRRVAVHPARLHTLRASPAQARVTISGEGFLLLEPNAWLCPRTATVVYVVSGTHSWIVEG